MSGTGTLTALVFAGGGSLGAVQVGMLKALVSHGVKIDCLVGTSVGALNAAYFAGNPTLEGVRGLERIWRNLRRRRLLPLAPLAALLGLLSRCDHFIDPGGLVGLIRRELPYYRLEEAKIPCHIVATDLFTGAEVALSSGLALKALLASAAIPGVLPPVRIRDWYLIDGGVANHTPLSTAVELGAGRVIVLPTGAPCALAEPPRGMLEMALHALNLLTLQQLVRDASHYAQRAKVIIVPPLCPLSTGTFDFTVAGKLIERAEKSTRAWLRNHGLEPAGIPAQLSPHYHEAGAPMNLRHG